jgi:hypothetical protein
MNDHPCTCKEPRWFLAFVPCWPFRAIYCAECQEVQALWGSALQLVWDAVVYPRWDGRVKITKREMSRGGYVRPPRKPWPREGEKR